MKQVVIFIGRSFLEADKALVNELKDHLRQFEQQGIIVTDAEPGMEGSARTKVMGVLDSAHAFLGILSRRHYYSARTDYPRATPNVIARALDAIKLPVQWDASPWTFQESGYAIAKEKRIILLVEEGVEDVGGLHGDIVRIRFSRTEFTRCFSELTGQLLSLLERADAGKARAASEESPPSTPSSPPTEAATEPEQLTRRMMDSVVEMIEAFHDEGGPNQEAASKAYREALSQVEDDEDRDFVEMTYLETGLRVDVYGSLAAFEQKLVESPSRRGFTLLARYYADTGEHHRALELFELALKAPVHRFSLAVVLLEQSKSLLAVGELAEARRVLSDALTREDGLGRTERGRVCVGLAQRARDSDDANDEASWLELSLSYNPADHDTRFRLAYLYADMKRGRMALYHYDKLRELKPSAAVENNRGVELEKLGAYSLAVAAYKNGSAQGNTLATSNIANLLIERGFIEESERLLAVAEAEENPHENVATSRARLASRSSEDHEREEKELQAGEQERQFHALFGRLRLAKSGAGVPPSGKWVTEWGDMDVVIEAGVVRGNGLREGTATELGETLFRFVALRLGKPESVLRRTLVFEGKCEGSVGVGEIKKRVSYRDTAPSSDEESMEIRFAVEGDVIHVLKLSEKGGLASGTKFPELNRWKRE